MSRFDAGTLARALEAVRGRLGAPAPAADASTPQATTMNSGGAVSPPADLRALAVAVAATLCRRFEGWVGHPYLCAAGVPSIGYGATHYADGRPVRLTDPPISREAGERLLVLMLEREYLPAVMVLCPGVTDPDRLAALLDFTYNLGPGALRASTLRRRVNAEEWDAVPDELRRWVFAAGKRLRGLVLRREAEAALI